MPDIVFSTILNQGPCSWIWLVWLGTCFLCKVAKWWEILYSVLQSISSLFLCLWLVFWPVCERLFSPFYLNNVCDP